MPLARLTTTMSPTTAAALLMLGTLAGCGAHRESPPAAVPEPTPAVAPESMPGTTTSDSASAPDPSPATLQEAEAALEQAQADLDALALGGAPASQAAGPPPASAPQREEALREESSSSYQAGQKRSAATPCHMACKAFSSLLRARDAVCRLEQPRGPRCERADSIAKAAEARVQSCACPD